MNTDELYIDGFVIPIKKDKIDEYKKMAEEAGKIWLKHGALQYIESVGDDLEPNMEGMPPEVADMKMMTFPQLAQTGPNETVIFSFIIYKSRAHRDEVNKKVMEDPAMNDPQFKDMPMPFDMTRMCFGGFQSLVNLSNK